jgi:phage gp36-like protein
VAAQQYLTRAEFLDQTIPADAISGLADATIDKALVWASGVAGSYLRKRYCLPLIVWGEELRSAVGELAQWKLFGRLGIRPGSGNNEMAEKRYDDAIAWFKDVARGLVEIDCTDSTPMLEEDGPLAESVDEAPSFRFNTGTGSSNSGCCDDE